MAQLSYRTADHERGHYSQSVSIERIAADWGDAIRLIGRILIGGIFIQSGLAKLMALDGFAALLTSHGVPWAPVLAPIGAAVEFGGGLAIVLGVATRYAALLMIAFVIVATAISHRFWALAPDQASAQAVHFAKNIAIIGGFLFVLAAGGGAWSLERWRYSQQPYGRV
jgi:putative oxidoreductase